MTAIAVETRHQIHRLTRARAARARCAEQVTRFTAKATLARAEQVRGDWAALRDEARRNRDDWDTIISELLTALRD